MSQYGETLQMQNKCNENKMSSHIFFFEYAFKSWIQFSEWDHFHVKITYTTVEEIEENVGSSITLKSYLHIRSSV